ncbi:MAG: LysM peptidoglycan-binding domain-containing protein [Ekhidna sp.]|nr:LysM peptidoglycan-binding domain-containing protein [Ekhidna sp.]
MRFVFTICSLSWALLSNAEVLDSIRAEQRSEGLFIIHQIEEEETIYSLAKRYGGSVDKIITQNQIVDNRIDIGQIIEILVEVNTDEQIDPAQHEKQPPEVTEEGYHLVGKGETLYSISKKYDVKVKNLKKWNNLKGDAIVPDMRLKIDKRAEGLPEAGEDNPKRLVAVSQEPEDSDSIKTLFSPDLFENFESYVVQTGETLYTIADKIGVSIDSLRDWNKLKSDYLKIGQKLWFKENEQVYNVNAEKNKIQTDENGFEKIYEEGLTSVIESMNTSKYLALHRSLSIGTNIEVRNLMNNQVVHVKVVGKLPDTGLNQNLMLRLSKPAYDQLGILDSRSRVEISYFKK